MNDERVQVVGQTLSRGRVAGSVELVDGRSQSLLAVALAGGVIECLPVALADTFAFAFGQLGEHVAHAVNGAVLAV